MISFVTAVTDSWVILQQCFNFRGYTALNAMERSQPVVTAKGMEVGGSDLFVCAEQSYRNKTVSRNITGVGWV
jgi:hypothetical protein